MATALDILTLRLEAAAAAALRARFPNEAETGGLEAAATAALAPGSLAPAVFATNLFAGGGAIVDRHNNLRDDESFIETRLNDSETRYLLFVGLSPLEANQRPALLSRDSSLVTALLSSDIKADLVLLGQLVGEDVSQDRTNAYSPARGDWLAALNVDVIPPSVQLPPALAPGDMRKLSMALSAQSLSPWEASSMAQARSCLEFVRRHRFCGACGRAMRVLKGGIELQCEDRDGCRTSWFPRSDPVAIMLVVDPATDRALLGRQSRWPEGRWSALAGFMEHGESAEDAVRRETFEESGVRVGRCRYHSSQPWPWPYSLMLGFVAEATDPQLNVDTRELEAAAWYTREEMGEMLRCCDADSGLRLPPAGTIAHQLCAAFVAGHPITAF